MGLSLTTTGRMTGRQLKDFLDNLDDEDLDLPLWNYGQTEVKSVEVRYSYDKKETFIILEGRK